VNVVLTIFAAASLTNVFPQIAAKEHSSFSGSNQLAAQIQQGAPADVFASANTSIPFQLYDQGLVEKPVLFTRNQLALIVPKGNPAGIHSVADVARPGVKLVVAAPGVPVGDYTRTVLKNMNLSNALNNVVSNESDVREVLAKVALGEADAGFVYSTDARTVPGKVNVIKIPAWAQPKVTYAMAVVSSSIHKTAAKKFIAEVLSKAGQKKLIAAGFLPLPRR